MKMTDDIIQCAACKGSGIVRKEWMEKIYCGPACPDIKKMFRDETCAGCKGKGLLLKEGLEPATDRKCCAAVEQDR